MSKFLHDAAYAALTFSSKTAENESNNAKTLTAVVSLGLLSSGSLEFMFI